MSSERGAQPLQRLVHVGTGCGRASSENGGDVRVAQILELAQQKRGALTRRKSLDGADDAAAALAIVGGEESGVVQRLGVYRRVPGDSLRA